MAMPIQVTVLRALKKNDGQNETITTAMTPPHPLGWDKTSVVKYKMC